MRTMFLCWLCEQHQTPVLVLLWMIAGFGAAAGPKHNYEMTLTTANTDYINPDFLGSGCYVRVNRKARRCEPTLNAFFPFVRDLQKPLNATYVAYQKEDNKWKETMVKITWDFCQTLEAKVHLHRIMLDRSTFPKKCPIEKGNYTINDFKFDHKYLPPVAVPGTGTGYQDWRAKAFWSTADVTITIFWFEFKLDRKRA